MRTPHHLVAESLTVLISTFFYINESPNFVLEWLTMVSAKVVRVLEGIRFVPHKKRCDIKHPLFARYIFFSLHYTSHPMDSMSCISTCIPAERRMTGVAPPCLVVVRGLPFWLFLNHASSTTSHLRG